MALKSLRTATSVVAACTMAALALGGSPARTQAQATTASAAAGWRLTQVYGTGQDNYDPTWPGGLAAPTKTSAWMTWGGCVWPCPAGNTLSVLDHWNGHEWSAVPSRDLLGLSPDQVAASSATDVWLLGPVAGSRYYGLRHWNGSKWAKVAAPSWMIYANGALEYSIYMADFGPGNLWLFSEGGYVGIKRAYAAHYQDGRWSRSYLPDIPDEAAALSANNIWATGEPVGSDSNVVMHWNGRHWTTSAFPKQPVAGYPFGLVATGPDSLWLAWESSRNTSDQYLLHWAGHRWAKVDLPAGDTVLSMTGDGDGGLWVAAVGPGKSQPQLFLHWSAGRWQTARVPFQFTDQVGQVDELAQIGGTESVWGVGHVYGAGPNGLNRVAIWRYNP